MKLFATVPSLLETRHVEPLFTLGIIEPTVEGKAGLLLLRHPDDAFTLQILFLSENLDSLGSQVK